MNELSQFIFGILQSVFLLVLIYLAIDFFIRFFFPSAKWHRRLARNIVRKTSSLFLTPFEKFYEASKWLIIRIFTTAPEFNFRQVFLENYPVTPLEFFSAVEEVFASKQIDGAEVVRITRPTGAFFLERRIYLVIQFRRAAYIIGATPLGTNFLVTLRFTELPSRFLIILFQIPVLGNLFEFLIVPPTFYQDDVYRVFEQSVRSSVLEASNALAQMDIEIRPLTLDEQRPLLEEFYQ